MNKQGEDSIELRGQFIPNSGTTLNRSRLPFVITNEPQILHREVTEGVPAENARAEELSTKTACTLLFSDHSSRYFLYSAVMSGAQVEIFSSQVL